MTFSASLVRMAAVSVTFVFAAGVWSTTADAQPRHSLSGNARYQIGDGLPVPIGGTPTPDGRIAPVPGAFVKQGAGADPKSIQIKPSQLTAPGNAIVLPVFANNPNVFQVKTRIPIALPGETATLSARIPLKGDAGPIKQLGRTGYKTVTFCPGQAVADNGNPACPGGGGTGGPANPGLIAGKMTYTRTLNLLHGDPEGSGTKPQQGNQFGGTMQAGGPDVTVTGTADVALRAASAAPCKHPDLGGGNPGCLAIFAIANPAGTGAQGAPFGFVNGTLGAAPNPGLFAANILGNGLIISMTAGQGAGLPNPATSYGGPWTTGILTVSQPAALGTPEVFILSGSDARVNGVGSISLVSGTVSDRGVSGPNANRGWLNFELGIKQVVTPSMSGPGLAAVFGLLALAGGYAIWRRRNQS